MFRFCSNASSQLDHETIQAIIHAFDGALEWCEKDKVFRLKDEKEKN